MDENPCNIFYEFMPIDVLFVQFYQTNAVHRILPFLIMLHPYTGYASPFFLSQGLSQNRLAAQLGMLLSQETVVVEQLGPGCLV